MAMWNMRDAAQAAEAEGRDWNFPIEPTPMPTATVVTHDPREAAAMGWRSVPARPAIDPDWWRKPG